MIRTHRRHAGGVIFDFIYLVYGILPPVFAFRYDSVSDKDYDATTQRGCRSHPHWELGAVFASEYGLALEKDSAKE